MKRRGWLIGGAGAAALAAGLGWRALGVAPGEQGLDLDAGGLWPLRFERPGGGELVMASLRGQPLLLNFWATWCPPCVKEMPEIDRFHRRYAAAGWRVVGLAVDRVQPVRDFLARTPVAYEIGMAGFDGTELSRSLGNDTGALPYTVAIGRDGRVRHRKLGESSFDELARWAESV